MLRSDWKTNKREVKQVALALRSSKSWSCVFFRNEWRVSSAIWQSEMNRNVTRYYTNKKGDRRKKRVEKSQANVCVYFQPTKRDHCTDNNVKKRKKWKSSFSLEIKIASLSVVLIYSRTSIFVRPKQRNARRNRRDEQGASFNERMEEIPLFAILLISQHVLSRLRVGAVREKISLRWLCLAGGISNNTWHPSIN